MESTDASSTEGLTAGPTSVPFKFVVSQSRRRSRLDIPLRLKALQAVVVSSFPALKGKELRVSYKDDEDDEILVLSDEELEESLLVFKELGRVLSFTVSVAPEKAPVASAPPLPCPSSKTPQAKRRKMSAAETTVAQMHTDIVAENGSHAKLLPCNTLVSPKLNRAHLTTASIPGLTVRDGKWMYEVHLQTDGLVRVGWAGAEFSCQPWQMKGVGDDSHSWSMDGRRLLKWHNSRPTPFGRRWGANGWRQWQRGDVIASVYNADEGTISFQCNGEPLGLAFCIAAHTPLRPAVSLEAQQKITFALETSALRFPIKSVTPIASAVLPSPTTPPCPLPAAKTMKFGLHPGPFIIANRARAATASSNLGYLRGFVCDVKDESVCSQKYDTQHTWWHCPSQQYDVCRGCFRKYVVPAEAAPRHFAVVPTPANI